MKRTTEELFKKFNDKFNTTKWSTKDESLREDDSEIWVSEEFTIDHLIDEDQTLAGIFERRMAMELMIILKKDGSKVIYFSVKRFCIIWNVVDVIEQMTKLLDINGKLKNTTIFSDDNNIVELTLEFK